MMFHDWIKKISPAVKTGETSYFRNHEGSYYDVMPYVWKKMYVPVQREAICIIDIFLKSLLLVSVHGQKNVLSLVCFFS